MIKIMIKITNIIVNESLDGRYYIQINKMSNMGEYSDPLTFEQLESLDWIEKDTIDNLINFIVKENKGHKYNNDYDSICFHEKYNAQNVVDKLISMYEFYLLSK